MILQDSAIDYRQLMLREMCQNCEPGHLQVHVLSKICVTRPEQFSSISSLSEMCRNYRSRSWVPGQSNPLTSSTGPGEQPLIVAKCKSSLTLKSLDRLNDNESISLTLGYSIDVDIAA